ncbi:MAG: molybdenum cofactor cytidylyltransferase [Peptostreptococcaceae bacterium]
MITVIVMASGLAKRMGENKLLLKYNKIPIIEHSLKAIQNIEDVEVIVVSQYEEVLKLAKQYNFIPIKNNNSKVGQSESIKLGILNSKSCDGYMFFVGDQPLINKEDIEKIIKTFNEDKSYIVIPKYNIKVGNPVIFPYNKRCELLSLKNDEKGKKVVNTSTKIKYVEVCENTLFDIDTKEDYEKLRGE